MTEKPSGITFFDRLVSDIQSSPEGQLVKEKISEGDLKVMIDELLVASMKKDKELKIVPNLEVQMRDRQGFLRGTVSIDHPRGGYSSVGLSLVMGNSNKPGIIETKGKDIKPNLSLRAQGYLAYKGIDIDQVFQKLGSPHLTLQMYLVGQLKPKGLHLSYMEANFAEDNTLTLGFKCNRIPLQR